MASAKYFRARRSSPVASSCAAEADAGGGSACRSCWGTLATFVCEEATPANRRTAVSVTAKRCAVMRHLRARLVRSGLRLRLLLLFLLVLVFIVAAAEYALPEAGLLLI